MHDTRAADAGAQPLSSSATVVRFSLSGYRPSITQALALANLARRGAMAQYGRRHGGGASPLLSGKDALGQPLRGHQHTHHLVTDEDGDGLLDHLTLWTPAGLSADEVAAVAGLVELAEPGQDSTQVTLLACGGLEVLPPVLAGPSRVWCSWTPYVLTRHPKLRGGVTVPARWIDQPEDQVRRDLALRGYADVLLAVERTGGLRLGERLLGWGAFQRFRADRPPAVSYGVGFRLIFREPVQGPIALGYACHMGLGLFRAEVD